MHCKASDFALYLQMNAYSYLQPSTSSMDGIVQFDPMMFMAPLEASPISTIFYNILHNSVRFHGVLEPSRLIQTFLDLSTHFYSLLEHSGLFWGILEYSRTFQNPLGHFTHFTKYTTRRRVLPNPNLHWAKLGQNVTQCIGISSTLQKPLLAFSSNQPKQTRTTIGDPELSTSTIFQNILQLYKVP